MQKSDKQPEPEGKVVPVSFGGGCAEAFRAKTLVSHLCSSYIFCF